MCGQWIFHTANIMPSPRKHTEVKELRAPSPLYVRYDEIPFEKVSISSLMHVMRFCRDLNVSITRTDHFLFYFVNLCYFFLYILFLSFFIFQFISWPYAMDLWFWMIILMRIKRLYSHWCWWTKIKWNWITVDRNKTNFNQFTYISRIIA